MYLADYSGRMLETLDRPGTDTDVDLGTDLEAQFAEDVPCALAVMMEKPPPGCKRVGTWAGTSRCNGCGDAQTLIFCTSCRRLIRLVMAIIRTAFYFVPGKCGHWGWHHTLTWTRI